MDDKKAPVWYGRSDDGYPETKEPEAPPQPESTEPPAFGSWADIDKYLGPIEWSWKSWLPWGMLTILAGASGSGKSMLMLRVAACFVCGWPWPDGTPFTGEKGDVLWCEAEAAQALNLERAKSWGLPLDHIKTPFPDGMKDIRLDNPDHLNAIYLAANQPNIKMIVIDSLSGADPKAEKSPEDSNSVRVLSQFARDTGKIFKMSHHLRKKTMFDDTGMMLERLRGSSSIVQTARLVWALDNPDLRVKDWMRLQVIKSNLAKFPKPLGMNIGDAGVKFGLSPEEPKIETQLDKAIDMLKTLLDKEPLQQSEVTKETEGAGLSRNTVYRAKSKLGIVSIKQSDGHWYWSLPALGEQYEN